MKAENKNHLVEAHFSEGLQRALGSLQQEEPQLPIWEKGAESLQRFIKFIGIPGFLALTALAFGPELHKQISEQSGQMYEFLNSANESFVSSPIGKYFMDVIAHLSLNLQPDLVNENEPQLVQFTQFLDFLMIASGATYVAGKVLLPGYLDKIIHPRRERVLEGKEPLKSDESPNQVIIGPTELISDLADMQNPDGKLVVGIHNGIEPPASLGKTIDYHFPIDFKNLISAKLFKESGIDRTKELTFLCINPENGLFYGQDANPALSPEMIPHFLRALPREKLKDIKINILLSYGFNYLGQTTDLIEEFKHLKEELGVEIHWRYLEDVVMDELKIVVGKIKATKSNLPEDEQQINIILAGEGNQTKDREMLEKFKKAIEGLDEKVSVSIMSNHIFGEISLDLLRKYRDKRAHYENEGLSSEVIKNIADFVGLSENEKANLRDLEPLRSGLRKKLLEKMLQSSDLNIVYGDTDLGTSQLAELLIKARGAERSQTVCILEGKAAIQKAVKDNLLAFPLYQKAIDSLQ